MIISIIEREATMYPSKLAYIILMVTLLFVPVVSAEEDHIRKGFWGGIDAGAGLLNQSFSEEDEDDVYFFLGFKGGYTINPHFLVGLELSGWLLEADRRCQL